MVALAGQHFRPVVLNVANLLNHACPEQVSPLDERNTYHETIAVTAAPDHLRPGLESRLYAGNPDGNQSTRVERPRGGKRQAARTNIVQLILTGTRILFIRLILNGNIRRMTYVTTHSTISAAAYPGLMLSLTLFVR